MHTQNSELSKSETKRYARQLKLPDFGVDGQKKLKAARVLCVGAGGLGSPAALYLAAAGVGTLGMVDFDTVDVSNLQRQVLYGTSDVGRPKLEVAKRRLTDLNPEIRVVEHAVTLNAGNALEVLYDYDLVLDGTDTYATRYLINDACVILGKPNISASVFRFEGQVSVFGAPEGPCYRCLYPEAPPAGLVPNCGEGGVLGIVPGVAGTLQATEALKWIAGLGKPLVGRLLVFDALGMRFRELKIPKNPECPACGAHPTIRELRDTEGLCAGPAAAVREITEITTDALRARLSGAVRPLLLDVRNPDERDECLIPDSLFIPLGELAARHAELPRAREIVIYCAAGRRSAQAATLLQAQGFEQVLSLKGGISAWLGEEDA